MNRSMGPSVSSVLRVINTFSIGNWLNEVVFASICPFHLHIKMNCVCRAFYNCLFISICKPSQRLIANLLSISFSNISYSDCLTGSARQQQHVSLGTWNVTLHLFSPSASLSLLLTPSAVDYHLSVHPQFIFFPFLSFPCFPLFRCLSPLFLVVWGSFSPIHRCLLSDSLGMETKEGRRWRERDKTAESQVKSYFQHRCFFFPLLFLTLLSSLLLNV